MFLHQGRSHSGRHGHRDGGCRPPVPAEPECQATDVRPGGGNYRTDHEFQMCGLPQARHSHFRTGQYSFRRPAARHIRDGQRSYNMEEPPTAVTLSKLEHVLQINSMPPTSYTMVHWGSTLTLWEKNAMLQWIKDERLKIFGDMVGEEYAPFPSCPHSGRPPHGSGQSGPGLQAFS